MSSSKLELRHPLLIPPFTNDTFCAAPLRIILPLNIKAININWKKYGEINNWDVETRPNCMFQTQASFNQPLNKLERPLVTSYMFGLQT